MTLNEIKKAVDSGKKVYWASKGYEVRKNSKGDDYYIICIMNNNCIGLTWVDGVTLNGKESDFFMVDEVAA